MLEFKLLRAGLGVGSSVMVLAGLLIAFQPKTVAVGEVKTGINAMVETGQFSATARKPVLPGLMLLWGGVAGLAISALVKEPEPVVIPAGGDTPSTPRGSMPKPKPAAMPQPQPLPGDTLSELWSARVSFKRLATQLDLSTRMALLERSLQRHEGGWMKRLLRCPCLLVVGRPGSAKSSFAGALAISRELLIRDLAQTIVSDPNAHLKAEQRVWQQHWKLSGARDNWGEIGKAIADMYKRFADSQGSNLVSSIYDEMTAYEGNVDEKHLGGFLPQITSKARAAREYITIVSHNDTLKCLGGKAGEAKLKDDMVQLNLCSKSNDEGEFTPTGKGSIEGQDYDDKNKPLTQPVTVPRWFDPVILVRLFPEVYLAHSNNNESASEDGHSAVNHAVNDRYKSEDLTAAERPLNDLNDSDRYYLTPQHVRFVAARQVQLTVLEEIGEDVPLTDIVNALTAVSDEMSDSDVIKQKLKMGGPNYKKGRFILKIIKQAISKSEEN